MFAVEVACPACGALEKTEKKRLGRLGSSEVFSNARKLRDKRASYGYVGQTCGTGGPASGRPEKLLSSAPSRAHALPLPPPFLATGAPWEKSTAKQNIKPPTGISKHTNAVLRKIQSSYGVTPSFGHSRG